MRPVQHRDKLKKLIFTIGVLNLALILFFSLFGNLYFELFCGAYNSIECVGPRFIVFLNYFFSLHWLVEAFFEFFNDPSFLSFPFLFIQVLFIYTPAFLTLKTLIKRTFTREQDYSTKQHYVTFFLISFILLPSVCALLFKWQYIPPHFSKKPITINMWYADYRVPRFYLEDWSLFPYDIHAKTLGFNRIRARGEIPFVKLQVSTKVIDPSLPYEKNVKIYIRPKYKRELDDEIQDTCIAASCPYHPPLEKMYHVKYQATPENKDISPQIRKLIESFIVNEENSSKSD